MANKTQQGDSTKFINIDMALLHPNTGQLEGLPANPRHINEDKYRLLKKNIQEYPEMLKLRGLMVFPLPNGHYIVIGGNMRYRAMSELGYKDAPCVIIDADTPVERLKAYTIIDNNAFGEYDWDMIANEWDAAELADWGLDIPDDWAGFEMQDEEAEEDDFDESTVTENICKRGDIWQLGSHRLMCGDSTSADDVVKLMDGEKADMVLTDPPYGVNVVSNNGKVGADFGVAKKGIYKQIIADDTTETAEKAWKCVAEISDKHIIFGGNYFTGFLPQSDSWVIWDKRCDSGIRKSITDAEMAWCSFHTPIRIYRQLWNGMIREGEHEKRVHPTQKPVRLLADIISDFTKEGNTLLDVFGGSGSTLIACEQLNRKCYMMELDPHYCDVIIARWEKITGNKAVKIG